MFVFAISLLMKPNPVLALSGEVKLNPKRFELLIAKAKAGDGSAAEELATISAKGDVTKISDTNLRNLASLLDSPSGWTRMWAAGAIGNFGPRAMKYAPRLQQIVSEESCNMTGLTAADTASFSLQKMGITPHPFGCTKK